MRQLPLAQVYQLIEPGPVVLLTTAAKPRTRGGRRGGSAGDGRPNVMAMSWHMMVEFEPPLIACIVSEGDYSFAALRATKECVIAIPSVKLARQVVAVGNTHGGGGGEDGRPLVADKFKAFGLTPAPAALVSPPLIAECFANLECRVAPPPATRLVSTYNLFILEVVTAWITPPHTAQKHPPTIHHRGCGVFAVDGKTIRLKSRMR